MRDAQRERSQAAASVEGEPEVRDPNYPEPREMPVDGEGFTVAFGVEDAATEAASFFKEWGFVVFQEVPNPNPKPDPNSNPNHPNPTLNPPLTLSLISGTKRS